MMKPPSKTPEGEIIDRWREGRHLFEIERLPEPRRVGAGLRPYRLWMDGEPAYGGQWHYNTEDARSRASYCVLGERVSRILWLEARVNELQRDNHKLRQENDALKAQLSLWQGTTL